jgi:uncharacterized protein YqgC (DUF456 family)
LKTTRQIFSYACLGAGILGLVLPIIPGIPLLILGLGLLDPHHWLRKHVSSLVHRFAKRKQE